MDETCGMCDQPAITTVVVHVDDATGTFSACGAHVIDTFMTIVATVEQCAEHPFDKAIAALERKMRDGTGNDTDLNDLTRYRRLRDEAKHRHPSSTR